MKKTNMIDIQLVVCSIDDAITAFSSDGQDPALVCLQETREELAKPSPSDSYPEKLATLIINLNKLKADLTAGSMKFLAIDTLLREIEPAIIHEFDVTIEKGGQNSRLILRLLSLANLIQVNFSLLEANPDQEKAGKLLNSLVSCYAEMIEIFKYFAPLEDLIKPLTEPLSLLQDLAQKPFSQEHLNQLPIHLNFLSGWKIYSLMNKLKDQTGKTCYVSWGHKKIYYVSTNPLGVFDRLFQLTPDELTKVSCFFADEKTLAADMKCGRYRYTPLFAAKRFAHKTVSKGKESELNTLLLKTSSHPSVPAQFVTCLDGCDTLLFLEYYPIRSLQEAGFEAKTDEGFSWQAILWFTKIALEYVAYLHKNDMVGFVASSPKNIFFGLGRIGFETFSTDFDALTNIDLNSGFTMWTSDDDSYFMFLDPLLGTINRRKLPRDHQKLIDQYPIGKIIAKMMTQAWKRIEDPDFSKRVPSLSYLAGVKARLDEIVRSLNDSNLGRRLPAATLLKQNADLFRHLPPGFDLGCWFRNRGVTDKLPRLSPLPAHLMTANPAALFPARGDVAGPAPTVKADVEPKYAKPR